MISTDEAFFVYMKTLSPAAIDVELRSLGENAALTSSYFIAFIKALSGRLKTHRDFEAVQTFLAVFLRLHGSSIVEADDDDTRRDEDDESEDGHSVREALQELADVQRIESERLLDLVSSGLGTLSFVRDTT